jgi:hypothetical protein
MVSEDIFSNEYLNVAYDIFIQVIDHWLNVPINIIKCNLLFIWTFIEKGARVGKVT